MTEIHFLVEEAPEGGLVARARPAAPSASPAVHVASITSPLPIRTRCASAPWRRLSMAWPHITA